ncbi:hypothetical protein [Helicobacter typhlonius]|uniref:hypothetical protein n=1 Tax=Helicobacter typhlonius TaxID=76936 RepID=UPI002FE18AB4
MKIKLCKSKNKAGAREFFKPFYIYGLNARYLSSHFFANKGYIYQKGGVECLKNGYKCVDVIKK